MDARDDPKLELLCRWLQINGVQLRGCEIRSCGQQKGYGLFASDDKCEGVLLVVPLDLAITPMRVLQDPIYSAKCRPLFEEGDVDDRFLMMLFLTVEHAMKNSSWKPYLEALPSSFGTPLWFTEDELVELKGTTLHKASILQKKKLQELFDEKVKPLAEELLCLYEDKESVIHFEDFLWANSIFWTRALNIPLPHSFVFPKVVTKQLSISLSLEKHSEDMNAPMCKDSAVDGDETEDLKVTSSEINPENVWVEGLVPGIDFCNHGSEAGALWEVDASGGVTGIPFSMYLLSTCGQKVPAQKEILISYGNKGNEELLYLYGFIIEKNPDDYLMVHYPLEALQQASCPDSKGQLLEIQKAELRCILPKDSLKHGFFGQPPQTQGSFESDKIFYNNYSWSGQRKVPSYLDKLVFPEDFLTGLRTIAMQENELLQVSSLLEELVGSAEKRQPTETEVRAAVWEVCGDAGALQLLVDLLNTKMMELEEGSGTEDEDIKLLQNACMIGSEEENVRIEVSGVDEKVMMSKNKWSSIVYRLGQKQLTRLFLREAEHALEICLSTA
ncbi:uncharacterized protein LOC116248146 isoform X2 [Nymphaea colorata]|uniref:uncharacterized protein LOC116248146 isoform X2 n=1 Tax=Nymphaea colorata TaxID=210225 RepID=UPI00214EC7DA|nr:uncharacterized protein LOC116248146 isoform X2 [Nymphaea colorata]